MKNSKVLSVLVVLAMTSSMFGALIAYEGWDAAVGSDITDCTTGTGFSDAGWVAGTAWGSAGITGSDSTIVPGLTYAQGGLVLITSGNAARMSPPIRAVANDDGWFMNRTISTTPGTVMWFSYLFMTTNASVYATDLDCGPSAAFETCATPGLHWSEEFKFVNGGNTGVKPVPNQTYFVVAKYTSGADAELWVDPVLNVEPTSGTSGKTSGTFGNGVNFRIKKNANQPLYKVGTFDEIRMGDTYADVAPLIPEPAFGIIALLGAFALRFRK